MTNQDDKRGTNTQQGQTQPGRHTQQPGQGGQQGDQKPGQKPGQQSQQSGHGGQQGGDHKPGQGTPNR